MAETTNTQNLTTEDMDAILMDLKGFGITDAEEIVTMTVQGRKIQLRIANVSNDDEITGMVRCETVKGHAWVQRMRCEILAKAITWINGADLSQVEYALDPYSGDERPIRLILVDLLMKWGQECVLTLWKIYMVHCQRIEDDLMEQLPDSQIMTETEKRFLARVEEELVTASAQAIAETADLAAAPLVGEEQ